MTSRPLLVKRPGFVPVGKLMDKHDALLQQEFSGRVILPAQTVRHAADRVRDAHGVRCEDGVSFLPGFVGSRFQGVRNGLKEAGTLYQCHLGKSLRYVVHGHLLARKPQVAALVLVNSRRLLADGHGLQGMQGIAAALHLHAFECHRGVGLKAGLFEVLHQRVGHCPLSLEHLYFDVFHGKPAGPVDLVEAFVLPGLRRPLHRQHRISDVIGIDYRIGFDLARRKDDRRLHVYTLCVTTIRR